MKEGTVTKQKTWVQRWKKMLKRDYHLILLCVPASFCFFSILTNFSNSNSHLKNQPTSNLGSHNNSTQQLRHQARTTTTNNSPPLAARPRPLATRPPANHRDPDARVRGLPPRHFFTVPPAMAVAPTRPPRPPPPAPPPPPPPPSYPDHAAARPAPTTTTSPTPAARFRPVPAPPI